MLHAEETRAFISHHYRHFNAAALVDAAEAYQELIDSGGRMFLAMAGAMSTAELGLSLAEMVRQDKIHAICCTGANLEEDLYNLVAYEHYVRVPNYYVVADGALEVTRGGASVATVRRGDGVGEISLLRGVPSTATVRAAGAAHVYAMEAEAFVEAVTCHPASVAAAEQVVRERQPPMENIDSRSCWEKTSKATIV